MTLLVTSGIHQYLNKATGSTDVWMFGLWDDMWSPAYSLFICCTVQFECISTCQTLLHHCAFLPDIVCTRSA